MKFSLSCLHTAMYTDGLPWLQGFRFPRIWLPVFTTNCENAFLTSERKEEYGGNTTRAPGVKLIHFTEFTFHCLRVIHCRPLYNGQYSMLNPLQWNSLMTRLNFLYFDGKWWMRINIRFGSVHIWSGVKLFFSLRKWFWLLRTILFLVHSAECYYFRQQFCTKEMKLHRLWYFANKVYLFEIFYTNGQLQRLYHFRQSSAITPIVWLFRVARSESPWWLLLHFCPNILERC